MAGLVDVLSYVPLTESVQTVKPKLPRPPEVFFTTTEDVPGTKARLIEFGAQRKSARISPAGSPPKVREKISLNDKALVLLSSAEEMEYSEELINVFMNWDSYTPQQQFAARQVLYQGEAFADLFDNLETACCQATLANGVLYFDGDGNLLPSSSGAVITVDQGVPANNKGQLNSLLTGSFADASFDIITFIEQKLKPRALQDTNYPIRTAIYGANIPGYLANNNFTKLAWAYQNDYANYYMTQGGIKPGFLGLNWIPASEWYWQDQNGGTQVTFPADQITFMPQVDRSTWTWYRGSTQIQTQWGPLASAMAALKTASEIYGRWRMAWVPPASTFKIIDSAGTKFLPRMKVPGAVYFLDTTP